MLEQKRPALKICGGTTSVGYWTSEIHQSNTFRAIQSNPEYQVKHPTYLTETCIILSVTVPTIPLLDPVDCTALSCGGYRCSYNGRTYSINDKYDAGDRCNTCACLPSGLTVCTQHVCSANSDCIASDGRVSISLQPQNPN